MSDYSHAIIVPKTWRSELFCFTAFVALGIIGIYLSSYFPISIVQGELFTLFGYTVQLRLPLFWFMPFAALITALLRIYNVRYVVDNRGIHCTTGIMGFYQRTTSIRYEDVRGISLDQTLLERSLGIGKVSIGTAATGETEVVLDGIGAPQEVQMMITNERDKRQKNARRALHKLESTSSGNEAVA